MLTRRFRRGGSLKFRQRALLGVAVQQLHALDGQDDGAGPYDQLPLDMDGGAARGSDPRRRAVEDSMDAVRRRFGDDAVGAAALLDRGAHVEPDRGAGK